MTGVSWQPAVMSRAQRTLPSDVYAYVAAGSFDSVTRDEAHAAWQRVRFAPRVLRDVETVDLRTDWLGRQLASPLAIAPTAMQAAIHPDGEVAMARAAAERGWLHVVSINAGCRFTDLGAAGGVWWLQVYLTQDRDHVVPVLRAAADAGARALVLTVDTPFPGPKPDVPDTAFDGLDGRWRVNFSDGAAVGDAARHARDIVPEDIGWLRRVSGLDIVVKGVLRPDDARRCVQAGASAVYVSNHGGRQLDRAVTTAEVLPAVVAAVGGSVPVYVDGGIGSGLDALAALGLGADGVLLGRLPLLALAGGGAAAVSDALTRLDAELADALALGGLTTPSDAPTIIARTPPDAR